MEYTTIHEGHLGGYYAEGDPHSFCPEMWKYLIERFDIKSVIDVGCGMGYSVQEFLKYCDDVVGIEGSPYAIENSPVKDHIFAHDYTVGELETEDTYDLCWCCEFVEHVEEDYRDNFLSTFAFAKYVAMTHAVPGQGGYHHVNCQPTEYWIEHMSRYGFEYDDEVTQKLIEICKEESAKDGSYKHFISSGLFFKKVN